MRGLTIGGEVVVVADGRCAFCSCPVVDVQRWSSSPDRADHVLTSFEVRPCRHVYRVVHPAELSPREEIL